MQMLLHAVGGVRCRKLPQPGAVSAQAGGGVPSSFRAACPGTDVWLLGLSSGEGLCTWGKRGRSPLPLPPCGLPCCPLLTDTPRSQPAEPKRGLWRGSPAC